MHGAFTAFLQVELLTQAGTLAAQLQQPRGHAEPQPMLALTLGRRVPLEGAELAAWQEARSLVFCTTS